TVIPQPPVPGQGITDVLQHVADDGVEGHVDAQPQPGSNSPGAELAAPGTRTGPDSLGPVQGELGGGGFAGPAEHDAQRVGKLAERQPVVDAELPVHDLRLLRQNGTDDQRGRFRGHAHAREGDDVVGVRRHGPKRTDAPETPSAADARAASALLLPDARPGPTPRRTPTAADG